MKAKSIISEAGGANQEGMGKALLLFLIKVNRLLLNRNINRKGMITSIGQTVLAPIPIFHDYPLQYTQPPDLSANRTRLSIVNNLFPQQQQLQNQHRQQAATTTTSRTSSLPFKTPSFSTGLTGSSSQYLIYQEIDNTFAATFKRNSVSWTYRWA
ncbi:CNT_HP2_G0048750.mRNA.1.CDS.1 [Saccharomyces cerevisiae]|nr:CNT_HP2_G0048750.mRNA.1.CDS.1 [Saccharomyces cerevisiae]CAI6782583.1 CNT_HP2_G0048750.mRNA.1.CDS.1 [Saccharomyces cerevisiae]